MIIKNILTPTKLLNPINCNITKRTMHRATNTIYHHGTPLLLHTPRITNNMSTYTGNKFNKNAVTNLANDGTGAHIHITKDNCIQADCEKKICKTLCNLPKNSDIKGHNTHKPPIGRFCRFISETDASGKTNAQYFVPTNEKKSITTTEKESYGNNIKNNTKQQPFIDQHADKYE